MDDWKQRAEALFFVSKLKINDIADELDMSRKAVSGHLKTCEGFQAEKDRRKDENADKRKEYQTNWVRNFRYSGKALAGDMLRKQHETDVKILSYERIY